MNSFEKASERAKQLVKKHQARIQEHIREKEICEHSGEGVFCPVCNSSFSSFAPFYTWRYSEFGLEEHCTCSTNHSLKRCPSCSSQERQRLLWLYLQHLLKELSHSGMKVLEFAPDRPFFDYFSRQSDLIYFPCDLYPEKEKYEGIKDAIIRADICSIPFEENTFDLILCSHVLEHVANDRLAMSELLRVMKPGALLVFQVPINTDLEKTFENSSIVLPFDRQQAFGQYDHVRQYGNDFADILCSAGFVVKVDNCSKSFSPEEINRYGLCPEEVLFVCGKVC